MAAAVTAHTSPCVGASLGTCLQSLASGEHLTFGTPGKDERRTYLWMISEHDGDRFCEWDGGTAEKVEKLAHIIFAKVGCPEHLYSLVERFKNDVDGIILHGHGGYLESKDVGAYVLRRGKSKEEQRLLDTRLLEEKGFPELGRRCQSIFLMCCKGAHPRKTGPSLSSLLAQKAKTPVIACMGNRKTAETILHPGFLNGEITPILHPIGSSHVVSHPDGTESALGLCSTFSEELLTRFMAAGLPPLQLESAREAIARGRFVLLDALPSSFLDQTKLNEALSVTLAKTGIPEEAIPFVKRILTQKDLSRLALNKSEEKAFPEAVSYAMEVKKAVTKITVITRCLSNGFFKGAMELLGRLEGDGTLTDRGALNLAGAFRRAGFEDIAVRLETE